MKVSKANSIIFMIVKCYIFLMSTINIRCSLECRKSRVETIWICFGNDQYLEIHKTPGHRNIRKHKGTHAEDLAKGNGGATFCKGALPEAWRTPVKFKMQN